jgi:iron complex transport system permease protein
MLALLTPYVLVPLALSLPLVRWANLLLLGDQQARNLGVPVETARLALLALAGVLAAASVAGAGLVGFVGLVVPHAVRLVVGPDNRELLPLAACGGGAFVVLCDALGRWLFAPLEVPVGIVTAMCGAPFFLWLLREKRAVTLE